MSRNFKKKHDESVECLTFYKKNIAKQTNFKPGGASQSYDHYNTNIDKKIIRGGSFLWNDTYCSGYRVASKMKSSPDTGSQHTGFRCVLN